MKLPEKIQKQAVLRHSMGRNGIYLVMDILDRKLQMLQLGLNMELWDIHHWL